MRWPTSRITLRARLILACVLVELAAIAALLAYGNHHLQTAMRTQAAMQKAQIVRLLNHALEAPLAQRDEATVQQTLELVRDNTQIEYLVLRDHRDRVLAAAGWDPKQPLPPRDGEQIDLTRDDATLHVAGDIVVAGQRLGSLDIGISTHELRQARHQFIASGLFVGALALLLSTGLLGLVAVAVTRRLASLAQASRRVAAGDFDVLVPDSGDDELGRVGSSFNTMARALEQRLSALHQAERAQHAHLLEVRDERSRLTTLLSAMQHGILFVDAQASVVYANQAFSRLWGLGEALVGQPLAELLPRIAAAVVPEQRAWISPAGDGSVAPQDADTEFQLLDGRLVVQRLQPVGGGGCIWLHQDITQDRMTQQRARQALTDPLTRLLNRRGLIESLQAALAHAARAHERVALMFIDLDDFKRANDLGGHHAGDEMLQAVARTLTAQMRRGEIVARLGGDEFAVLCPGLPPEEAGAVAERLVRAVCDLSVHAGGHALRVGCSVGIAHYPDDAQHDEELIAHADAAMYQAKHGGKAQWALYRADSAVQRAESARMDWNERIRTALRDGRFVLHFQPVLRAVDLRPMYHEALLRMIDETVEGRLVPPANFIAYAERSGSIRQIDRWVFGDCVRRLANGPGIGDLAVNLSARSLDDAEFVPFLRDLLQRHDVDPRRLHVELTETSAVNEPRAAAERVSTLRSLGVRVHLDDFGAGFSSLAQLKRLELDAIKIDGSLVRDLDNDAGSRKLVATIIDIARSAGKLTVAEHVENAATLDALRRLGVDLVQGFHLGRPAAETILVPASSARVPHLVEVRRVV